MIWTKISYVVFFLLLIKGICVVVCQNKVIIRGISKKKKLIYPLLIGVMGLNFLALGKFVLGLFVLQGLFLVTLLLVTEGVKGNGIVAQDKTTIKWDKIKGYTLEEKEHGLKIIFHTKYLSKRYQKIVLYFKTEDQENLLKVLDANIIEE